MLYRDVVIKYLLNSTTSPFLFLSVPILTEIVEQKGSYHAGGNN